MFETLFSKSGLSLDRLRSFLEMAEAGGIARAAPGDVNRQSQISRQVRELEEFFGVELTRRRGKTLTLSEAGRRLAGLIREQMQDLEDFRGEQAGEARTFSFGAGASILEWLVVPALGRVAERLGRVTLRTGAYRSRDLVDAVRDGRVDFAIVRQDALPPGAPEEVVMKLGFLLCIPRRLLKPGTTAREAARPALWQTLPFAAGRDGGQMDLALREGMAAAGVDFRPRFECGSLLQVRQLVELEACAAVLPSLGANGLDETAVLKLPFTPMTGYGRALVLHWNERQARRRGLEKPHLRDLARILRGS